MIFVFLYLFSFYIGLSVNAMIIDLQSIQMDPDLHRLCWKQFEDRSVGKYFSIKNRIIKIEDHNQEMYCIEKLSKSSESLIITIDEGTMNENVTLTVDFSIPLAPPLPVIRHKVSHDGVHFYLSNEFAGFLKSIRNTCQILVTYKSSVDQSPVLKKLEIDSTKISGFLKIDPGTSFNVYYTCKFDNSLTSSQFAFKQGSIFQSEKFEQLKPVMIFPFRKFLITKWDSPVNIPNAYVVVIYQISQNNNEKCLKIFRLFSEQTKISNSYEARELTPKSCNANVTVEDLGYYTEKSNKSVFAVLSMVIPLKFRQRYKLFISWMNPLKEVRNNYIYFEPLPNLNSGIKNPLFSSFEAIDFVNFRNNILPILQNEISSNSDPVYKPSSISVPFKCVIPILSTRNPPRMETLPLSNVGQLEARCNTSHDCMENYLYPFYFALLESPNNFYEILTVSKSENRESKIDEPKFKANNEKSCFSVSWNVKPRSVVQSFYLIKILPELTRNCSMLYILKCKTCSGIQKEVAEKNLKTIAKWKDACPSTKIMENYYDAVDRKISFLTNEMPPDNIFRAEIYSFGLYTMTKPMVTNTHYIKESFWQKYKVVVISVIGVGCLFIVIWAVYMWFKRLTISDSKEVDKEDSNKYYGEDDV